MAEKQRLEEDKLRLKNWKRWGPYLSERQWGTVREDYSQDGDCWNYFTHDQSRSRAYRWGEDGLLGFTDRQCRLCYGLALWNGKDPILKERLFGLTGPEGNHGEDVKENYYYLQSTPTHSYMKSQYKYPQEEFPYQKLIDVNRQRSVEEREYELEDTGVFDDNKYWDVIAEYAKADDQDILCKTTVWNRSSTSSTIYVIPTLWYRNTWIWGCKHEGCTRKANIKQTQQMAFECTHQTLDDMVWSCYEVEGHSAEVLFTENESNTEKLFGSENYTKFYKDAFHRYLIDGEISAVNMKKKGTKVGVCYKLVVPPGENVILRSRLTCKSSTTSTSDGTTSTSADGTLTADDIDEFEQIFTNRISELYQFYETTFPQVTNKQQMEILQQACAGLLHSKQFYHYVVNDWLNGDPDQIAPPSDRLKGRNHEWKHLFNRDVISMPDKWEYPWYASWDLAFHMIPFAHLDPEFAKSQLLLFLREWYMSPSGQIPAYEFAFDDVNPPVHAWAVFRVYKLTAPRGSRDHVFLARCFQKLILNFTWWVNRKDPDGNNVFSGGFLGLDNIGVFDRSKPLPTGGKLEQADGTGWMAFFCCQMLDISLELALIDPSYEDMASKFFEHFVSIVVAINGQQEHGKGLYDEEDGFFYDKLRLDNNDSEYLRVRSMVGFMPMYACLVLENKNTEKLKDFTKRTKWFLENKPELRSSVTFKTHEGNTRVLLSIPSKEQLLSLVSYLLDEDEFLSPYGIRSLSKKHEKHPYILEVGSQQHRVDYIPAESNTYLFGGNSNWRGPIWLCVNFLIVEALERYDYFYQDDVIVECPTGSGNKMRLKQVAMEICRRLVSLFEVDETTGKRPCHGDNDQYTDEWKDLLLFHEFFDAENGRGCGASHQTGWTALVVDCINKMAQAATK